MNVRLYPTVVTAYLENEHLSFDAGLEKIADDLLTDETVSELSLERYTVLMESLFMERFLASGQSDYWTKQMSLPYESTIRRFKAPTNMRRLKATFKTLLLCYAACGVIPVTQRKLGDLVQSFLDSAGEWKTKYTKHQDAFAKRLPGSFENGKRR